MNRCPPSCWAAGSIPLTEWHVESSGAPRYLTAPHIPIINKPGNPELCAGKKFGSGRTPSRSTTFGAHYSPRPRWRGTPLRKTMSDPMGFGELGELNRTLDEDMMLNSAVLDGALDAIYSKFDLGNPDDLASLYGVSPGAPDVRDVRVPAQTGTGTGSGDGSGDGSGASNPKIDGKDRQAETTSKAVGKRGRANLNQAEVQKRYRERKKNRMLARPREAGGGPPREGEGTREGEGAARG